MSFIKSMSLQYPENFPKSCYRDLLHGLTFITEELLIYSVIHWGVAYTHLWRSDSFVFLILCINAAWLQNFKKARNLLAIAVGIRQKENVNKIVSKVEIKSYEFSFHLHTMSVLIFFFLEITVSFERQRFFCNVVSLRWTCWRVERFRMEW